MNLQLVSGEPGLGPKGSWSRASVPTILSRHRINGMTVYVTACDSFHFATEHLSVGPRSYLAPAKPPPLLDFLFKVEFRWPWSSKKLTSSQEGAHPFIRHGGWLPGAVFCVTEARKQLRWETIIQTQDPHPAPVFASCGTLVLKPTEHLFPHLSNKITTTAHNFFFFP